MSCRPYHNDRDTVSTPRFGADDRIDDQGYLHTGHSQPHPDRVVIACGRTGARR